MRERYRELFGLIPVSLLVTAGFTAVLLTRQRETHTVTVTYGLLFLGACVLGHIFIRARLPHADPYLFPLAAVLSGFGLVMLYRIDPTLALKQAWIFVLGLAVFCATVVGLREYRKLEQYRYTIALIGIGLLVLPRVPGIGKVTNGAYLSIGIGPIQFQTAELSKIAIIIFLASYLSETRDVLVRGRVPRLSMKHLGPLLVIWGASMLELVVIRDLGSAVIFFGGFLAVLYVATARLSLVAAGLAMFVGGAAFISSHVAHVHSRVEAWLHPFDPHLYDATGGSYQLAQGLFAQADGGLFGQGFGQAFLKLPDGKYILPAPHTDLIYAVITDELGLFGACAVLVVCLLIVERGFKTAMLATDGFGKLLAAGLSAVFALQVFVIVGGVTQTIPLTGVTLPFISYGGSSIVANFFLLALLLIVSDRARRDPGAERGGLIL